MDGYGYDRVCICVFQAYCFAYSCQSINVTFLPPSPNLVTKLNNVTPKLACTHSFVKGSWGQRKFCVCKLCSVLFQNKTGFHFSSVDLGGLCFWGEPQIHVEGSSQRNTLTEAKRRLGHERAARPSFSQTLAFLVYSKQKI